MTVRSLSYDFNCFIYYSDQLFFIFRSFRKSMALSLLLYVVRSLFKYLDRCNGFKFIIWGKVFGDGGQFTVHERQNNAIFWSEELCIDVWVVIHISFEQCDAIFDHLTVPGKIGGHYWPEVTYFLWWENWWMSFLVVDWNTRCSVASFELETFLLPLLESNFSFAIAQLFTV